jgi:hypothetical protein
MSPLVSQFSCRIIQQWMRSKTHMHVLTYRFHPLTPPVHWYAISFALMIGIFLIPFKQIFLNCDPKSTSSRILSVDHHAHWDYIITVTTNATCPTLGNTMLLGDVNPMWNGTAEHHFTSRTLIDSSWAGKIHSPFPYMEVPGRPTVKVPVLEKVGKKNIIGLWGQQDVTNVHIRTYKPDRLFVRGKRKP